MVHTPFRKSWECDMSTRIRLNLKRGDEGRQTNRASFCSRHQRLDRTRPLRFELLLQPHAGVQIQVVRGFVQ